MTATINTKNLRQYKSTFSLTVEKIEKKKVRKKKEEI